MWQQPGQDFPTVWPVLEVNFAHVLNGQDEELTVVRFPQLGNPVLQFLIVEPEVLAVKALGLGQIGCVQTSQAYREGLSQLSVNALLHLSELVVLYLLGWQICDLLLIEWLRIVRLLAWPRVNRPHLHLPVFVYKNVLRPNVPNFFLLLMVAESCWQQLINEVPQLTLLKQLVLEPQPIADLVTQEVRKVFVFYMRHSTVPTHSLFSIVFVFGQH